MIEELGKVVKVEEQWAWVQTERKSVCGQCAANKGCGTSVLGKVFGQKTNVIAVIKTLPVKIGDQVVIGIDENSLVKGSLLIYALPLVLFIAFGMLGEVVSSQVLLSNTDVLTVLFAMFGLAGGFFWLKTISSQIRLNPRYQPKLLQIKNSIIVS
ncbi:MAG: SoxR reducing system RseC family protein [Gammaproteobacteria bacterium]|jgi:sigma-E factor negative regulatory protein RseC|nr:SoxR reducing system RseC family protein [Gammaproteobacteria bacterium]